MDNIQLVDKDLRLYDIEEQINARRKLILDKNKTIQNKKKQNHFLNEVKQDYETFYKYIINEKQQQYQSMELLNKYLDDLKKTNQLAEDELTVLKYDQKDILSEMDKIKLELNKLIA
jgi:hypothetical protein